MRYLMFYVRIYNKNKIARKEYTFRKAYLNIYFYTKNKKRISISRKDHNILLRKESTFALSL